MLDLVVLLANLHIAAQDDEIGYADATVPLRRLTYELQQNVNTFSITKDHLESCLWACNMLNEKRKFWTPWIRKNTMTFPAFISRCIKRDESFDKFYNVIKKKEVSNG